MTTIKANIGCLVNNVALGEEGKFYQARVDYWLKHNGPEWTSNRVKALWNAALNLKCGRPEMARKLYQDNSIAYHKSSMVPKGPEGRVVDSFVQAQRPSVLKRKAAALRFYTSLTLGEPSKQQIRKALHNIGDRDKIISYQTTKKYLEDQAYLDILTVVSNQGLDRLGKWLSTPPSQAEKHGEHLKPLSRYYSRNKIPKEMRDVPYTSMAMSLMTEPWIPDSIDKWVPAFEGREANRAQGWAVSQQFAGKITLLQEQGCKARVVAQPSAWLQLAFVPMHHRLERVYQSLFAHESCVHDQVKGVEVALQHLRNGGECFSTDLSAATDRFPLYYSTGVLRALKMEEYAEALEEVVKKPFACAFSPSKEIKYAKGQPMGLYGSFPLFHLSNALCAQGSAVKAEREYGPRQTFPDGTYFKVLGDDIIFADRKVEELYRLRMKEFGVEISEAKSFQGHLFEFGGFIGMKTNQTITAFRPYKVPDKEWVSNPIQFLDSLGAKVAKLGKSWERKFSLYQETMSSRNLDLSPIITDNDMGRTETRGDGTTLVSISNALHMYAEDCGYTLPGPSYDSRGRPTTRVNNEPLFLERRAFDYYALDKNAIQTFRRDVNEFRRKPHANVFTDPLMKEIRDIRERSPERPFEKILKKDRGTGNSRGIER